MKRSYINFWNCIAEKEENIKINKRENLEEFVRMTFIAYSKLPKTTKNYQIGRNVYRLVSSLSDQNMKVPEKPRAVRDIREKNSGEIFKLLRSCPTITQQPIEIIQ